MKAKDLVIGKEYYSNKSQDWDTSTWNTERVRVLETVAKDWHWQNGKLKEGRTYSWGNHRGVRVMILDKETGEDKKEDVVTLASLRGEWKPVNDAVQWRIAEKKKARELNDKAHRAASDYAGIAVDFAMKSFGIAFNQIRRGTTNRIEIDPIVFMEMAKELEKQGWTSSQKQ